MPVAEVDTAWGHNRLGNASWLSRQELFAMHGLGSGALISCGDGIDDTGACRPH